MQRRRGWFGLLGLSSDTCVGPWLHMALDQVIRSDGGDAVEGVLGDGAGDLGGLLAPDWGHDAGGGEPAEIAGGPAKRAKDHAINQRRPAARTKCAVEGTNAHPVAETQARGGGF